FPGRNIARSIRYSTSRPSSLHVGMSLHDCESVTLVLYEMRSLSKTHNARTCPARQTSRFSDGLLTLAAVWLPTSWVAASPPDLYGRYANFAPVFFSMKTVSTWSSRFDPVPPILNGGSDFFAASMNSFVVLYGSVALVHSTNSSSAVTATGVSSRQLKGIFAESGSM